MVDLEWGIPQQEQTTDPTAVDFKFKQLQKCHDLSTGPSFLVTIVFS
jgi:hypothetical protein